MGAAQRLFTNQDFQLLGLMLEEAELEAMIGLRRGSEIPKHVAAIQAVEFLRERIRLEAANSGIQENVIG